MLKQLSIRSKLLLMLLFVSFASSIVLIYIGYTSGKTAINDGIFEKLTSIRASKQYQIENYFDNISNIVETLGANSMTADAIVDFRRGFADISKQELNIQCRKELSIHYEKFIDRLAENVQIKPIVDLYYPSNAAACYLQYEYIVENPYEIGQKHQYLDAEDNSIYSEYHQEYHSYFKEVVEKFGFYDLFLVDLKNGDILYSVYKETDFATNLYDGPYSESNLAQLARQLRAERDLNKSKIIDFNSYRPSYGAPAAFIGIPVTRRSQTVGALILQLPVEEINNIMTGNKNWANEGLGKTGETYLVGEDYNMRSISRFFLEDSLGYKQSLVEAKVEESKIDLIFKVGTTILNQRVKTEAIENSIKGKSATSKIEDYRGVPVLSSYAPLDLSDLKWSIVSEQDYKEAQIPVKRFQKRVFIALFILLLLVAFLATYLASRFVAPIESISLGVKKIQEGDYNHRINLKGQDEISKLGMQFNNMIEDIDHNQKEIARQSAENEKLLLNFIPESIARRLQNGEQNIADNYQHVSLIVIDIIGFSALTKQIKAAQAITLLNDLIDAFDTSADKHQIEKIRTVGDTYFATCGLFKPRLDHSRRVLDFAFDLLMVINHFNINHKLELSIGIGIHTGDVTAGIVGIQQYNFDLIGTGVNTVFDLKDMALPNTIMVSTEVKDKLEDFYQFEITDKTDSESKSIYQCKSIKKSSL